MLAPGQHSYRWQPSLLAGVSAVHAMVVRPTEIWQSASMDCTKFAKCCQATPCTAFMPYNTGCCARHSVTHERFAWLSAASCMLAPRGCDSHGGTASVPPCDRADWQSSLLADLSAGACWSVCNLHGMNIAAAHGDVCIYGDVCIGVPAWAPGADDLQ